jgi:nucleoside-diphosphate-sugar epimerase
VTGVAGFIGSQLAERLLGIGCGVVGIDRFADYYPRHIKESNLARLLQMPGFELIEADLATSDIDRLLDGVDYVFHSAGQAGVLTSWGDNFAIYLRDNVLATQLLLEGAFRQRRLKRFIYASSSSIYGNATDLPLTESTLPRPVSPYGVTKLAAEHLCHVYAENHSVPAVSLRYFSVYGPRQRPDMAFSRFLHALLDDQELAVNGDGGQTRDFTFVSDVVDANLAAMTSDAQTTVGRAYNVGGGCRTSITRVIQLLEDLTGLRASVRQGPPQPGDARDTLADCSAAQVDLGFRPRVSLEQGLLAQLEWTRQTAGSVV